MTFSELLNQYIEELGCSAKALAEASGLPASVISRYRSGARVPDAESENLMMLAEGIYSLSDKTEDCTAESIHKRLTEVLGSSDFDYDRFAENFNQLIEATDLNINRLARFMNYDPSFISRIRTCQRRPANPEVFVDGVCRFVSTTLTDKKRNIASLIDKPVGEISDPRSLYNALHGWLCSEQMPKPDAVDHFLNVLDRFDLNDYIRAIKFDELKVPTVPFQLPTSKNYFGVEQMRAGELDFFKATVLSHSNEPIFMCSDMDMSDMAQDADFGKKWMFAIAMCLKKGLHLDMIHTIDRPFDELMLGLEGWIPIYMTGQISPFYLKNARSGVYQHLNYVSGAAALTGECVSGHHAQGKYYLTKKSDEIAYYREKSELILNKALPLMEIYRKEQRQQYMTFIENDASTLGKRHGILSAPPIYTIPDQLLSAILSHNGVSEKEAEEISIHIRKMKDNTETVLRENCLFDEVQSLSAEEFSEHPVNLALEGLFLEKEIRYSYEEYRCHLQAADAYAQTHENYSVSQCISRSFRNIQIFIHEGEFAVISKGNAPVVHFVVRQPKLREAIEKLMLPIVESQ